MVVQGLESLILFVGDLARAKDFYANALGLPIAYEDDVVVVVGGGPSRVVLHRNDRGHDDRGIFPAGVEPGAAALRFSVMDPDACQADAERSGVRVLWPAQDASWGRFVVVADPDGRPVVLAKMKRG